MTGPIRALMAENRSGSSASREITIAVHLSPMRIGAMPDGQTGSKRASGSVTDPA
ncbi:hypothetical protein TPA0907_15270 [Micromonospora humidisoli]|nr:hypothetical protein TPA0907_15270 [Micromonospora sp. AKA109]